MTVGNKIVHALLDTGAEVSLIKEKILPKYAKLESVGHLNIKGVTGIALKIIGKATIKVHFSNYVIEHTFIVCDKLNGNSIIIGLDIIASQHSIVDYQSSCYHIGNEIIPLLISSNLSKNLVITCHRTTTIPAYTTKIVNVEIHTVNNYSNNIKMKRKLKNNYKITSSGIIIPSKSCSATKSSIKNRGLND